MGRLRFLIPAVVGALLCASGVAAQLADVAPAPPAPPQTVEGAELSILIRTTMIALHQANVTGNYTVLRDLGATTLQDSSTAADLAAQFVDFRAKQIGLASTVLYDPILDQKPLLSTDGRLRLVGHFPTTPQEVAFDLMYLYQAGAWRIAVINVSTHLAKDAATSKPSTATVQPPKDLVPDVTAPPQRPKP